jgi:hypothetical protein
MTALSASGCKDSSTSPESLPSVSIWPLAVGNKWVYQYEYVDSTGARFHTTVDSVQVYGTISLSSETWYLLNGFMSDTLAIRSNGIYASPSSPVLILNFPATTGDSVRTSDTTYVKLTSINDTATVMGVIMQAYKYRHGWMNPRILPDDYYMVPNMGPIQIIMWTSQSYKSMWRAKLISISIK